MVTHVQTVANDGTSGATPSVSITTTAGNTLILSVVAYVGANTPFHVSAISDTHNTWTFSSANSNANPPVGQSYDGSLTGVTLIAAVVNAAAVTSIQVTFTGATPTYVDLVAYEFSGIPSNSAITVANASSTNTSAISVTTPTVTVPSGSLLAVAAEANDGQAGSSTTVGGSWSLDGGTDKCAAYQITPSAGSLSATFSSTGSQNWPSTAILVIGPSGVVAPVAQQPGGASFRRQWRQPQALIPGVPYMAVTAGLATGAGAAGSPAIGLQGGSATSTGAAGTPGIDLTPTVATGTGTAQAPGSALTPALASGTGAAFAPGTGLGPQLATGTGTAFSILPLGLGGYMPPQPGSQQWRRFFYRTQQQIPVGIRVSPALVVSGFGTFPQVPAGAVILSVIANITQYGSNAGVGAPFYQLWDGTTAQIGNSQTGTATTNTANVDSVVFTGVTYSQLATLQLRILAESQPGNTGATTNVDAVSLSVEWAPNANVLITPNVLKCATAFPKAAVGVGVTVTPGTLSATTALPAATAGLLAVNITPATLATAAVFPRAAVGVSATITPATLVAATALPAIIDVTGPGYATADGIIGTGNGAWSNIGNALGPPDGSDAVWTAP